MRLFGITRETADRIGFFARYDALGGFEGISSAVRLDAAAAREVISRVRQFADCRAMGRFR